MLIYILHRWPISHELNELLQNLERIAPYYGLKHRFLSVIFDQPSLMALKMRETEQCRGNWCKKPDGAKNAVSGLRQSLCTVGQSERFCRKEKKGKWKIESGLKFCVETRNCEGIKPCEIMSATSSNRPGNKKVKIKMDFEILKRTNSFKSPSAF